VSAGVPEQGVLRDFRQRRDARDSSTAPSIPPPKKPRSRRVPAKRPAPGPPPAPTAEEAVAGDGASAAGGSGLHRLATPRPVAVQPGERGVPALVGSLPVEAMIEEWVVEDRWWTGRPVRRRYFELVLAGGRNVVVFKDLVGGRWFAQRA
jgi:hypothetical protein